MHLALGSQLITWPSLADGFVYHIPPGKVSALGVINEIKFHNVDNLLKRRRLGHAEGLAEQENKLVNFVFARFHIRTLAQAMKNITRKTLTLGGGPNMDKSHYRHRDQQRGNSKPLC